MEISQEINNYISIIFLLLNIIVKEIIFLIIKPQKIINGINWILSNINPKS
jgi:hypothetical protein